MLRLNQEYLVQDNFWGHILRSATEGPRLTSRVNVLWESKVNHLDVALLVQKQILGLEISVDDASVVEVLKCAHLWKVFVRSFFCCSMILPRRQCRNGWWCRRTSLKVEIVIISINSGIDEILTSVKIGRWMSDRMYKTLLQNFPSNVSIKS